MAADRKLYLRNAWIGAHAAYGAPASGPEFEAILGAYGEVGRHYHTAEHLYRCLVAIDEEPSFASADDIAAVRLAVFFHDLVYDVTSAGNEAASDARWRSYAGRARFPPSVRELVSALILATEAHQVDRGSPFLLKVMNDIDMAILAAPPADYQDYARRLWLEYSRVGRDLYVQGRLSFLQKLDLQKVFATEPYIRRVVALRKNLAWEIRALMERPELVVGDS